MKAAVGPFSTSPPTIGLTATTGRIGLAQRLADAGHGEDRRDRGERVRRADHDRSRGRDRLEHLGARRACSAPRNSRPSIGPAARWRIMNSWKAHQPAAALRTHVRTGSSLIGSTRAPTPIASLSRASAAVGGDALGEQPRALQAPREVAVAEVEPHVHAAARAARPSRRRCRPRRPQPRSSIVSASQKQTRSGSGET